jgi:hypothetical protein
MTKLFNPYFDLYQILKGLPESKQLEARKKLIWAYSWAVPSSEAILKITQYSPLVELGSGTGYWAWLIQQAGGRVQCLDHEPHQPPHWQEIYLGDPHSLSKFPQETLLLCWPPLHDSMSNVALNTFLGKTIIYIGEWRGRTAQNNFHDELDKNWTLIESLPIPNWPGFTDQLYIFSRKLD